MLKDLYLRKLVNSKNFKSQMPRHRTKKIFQKYSMQRLQYTTTHGLEHII